MTNRLVLALALLLLGTGWAAYDYYEFTTVGVPDLEAQRRVIEKEFSSKQNEFQRLKEFAGNIERIKGELRELNLQLESSLEHMPRNFNLAGLLRKLTMLAQNSGVELSSFRPSKAETREGNFYSTIQIEFDLRGNFSQNLVFLDQVSRLKRIVNIESLKMSARDVSNAKGGSIVADSSGVLRTYRFTE